MFNERYTKFYSKWSSVALIQAFKWFGHWSKAARTISTILVLRMLLESMGFWDFQNFCGVFNRLCFSTLSTNCSPMDSNLDDQSSAALKPGIWLLSHCCVVFTLCVGAAFCFKIQCSLSNWVLPKGFTTLSKRFC